MSPWGSKCHLCLNVCIFLQAWELEGQLSSFFCPMISWWFTPVLGQCGYVFFYFSFVCLLILECYILSALSSISNILSSVWLTWLVLRSTVFSFLFDWWIFFFHFQYSFVSWPNISSTLLSFHPYCYFFLTFLFRSWANSICLAYLSLIDLTRKLLKPASVYLLVLMCLKVLIPGTTQQGEANCFWKWLLPLPNTTCQAAVWLKLHLVLCFSFVHTCVSVCGYVHIWVQVSMEARGYQVQVLDDYRQLWGTQRGCWEFNSGLLQEEFMFLPSSHLPSHVAYFWLVYHLLLSLV